MRINHNIAALNTYRQFNNANAAQGKSMEKLSSGLRINKAGDDAAGLAISEKMRGQIRGLDMASKNAQDGVSLLQTAEGALNETHSILQRMRELGVQSSNDTNTDGDRASIQTEISQLKDEVDRIGNTTEFNTKKLIDGSIGEKKMAGTNNAAVISTALGKETSALLAGEANYTASATALNTLTGGTSTLYVDGAKVQFNLDSARVNEYKAASNDTTKLASLLKDDINKAIETSNTANGTQIAKVNVDYSSSKFNITSGSTGATSTIMTEKAGAATDLFQLMGIHNAATAGNRSATGKEGVLNAAGAGNLGAFDGLTSNDAKMTFSVDGKDIQVNFNAAGTNALQTALSSPAAGDDMTALATALQTDFNAAITNYNNTVPTSEQVQAVKVTAKDGAFVVESGSDKATSSIKFDNSEAAQLLGLAKQSSATQGGGVDFQIGANQTQTMKITVEDMRTDALGIKDINLSTKEGAQDAINKIDTAIEKVSTQRSNLGAFQNRLEHTINNLGTSSENLTAAESRVRDVDMAKEMMEQTKNSILSQAAQAMLAQSNQLPQGVLQLLR
ncbi:flagellin [Priestia megaterium]|uniref:flagellin N-terminal helical domain-containing protein n=1 Tax=Priestia megaterium TaxID=1404 RepID=UPI00196BA933|nr:flagellin [Priestia megaterium]QSF40168.1 flagellin [Priestia megaterium]